MRPLLLPSSFTSQLAPWQHSHNEPASTTPQLSSHGCSHCHISTTPKVWIITSCSSGIGRALALEALSRGDRAIATARSVANIDELRARGATTVALDVKSPDDVVRETVTDAVALNGGRVDVLVNNDGHSLVGSAEECRY